MSHQDSPFGTERCRGQNPWRRQRGGRSRYLVQYNTRGARRRLIGIGEETNLRDIVVLVRCLWKDVSLDHNISTSTHGVDIKAAGSSRTLSYSSQTADPSTRLCRPGRTPMGCHWEIWASIKISCCIRQRCQRGDAWTPKSKAGAPCNRVCS